MDLDFESYALTINANQFIAPDLSDNNLYLFVKDYLLTLLKNENTEIIHFGFAPDNTADGQDELLFDGVLFRIIIDERYLGVELDASKNDILKSFSYIVENYAPFWSTVMIEKGLTKTETTIELLYKDL